MPTTDGESITVTYIYSSKYSSEIDEIERKLKYGMIIMDTDNPDRKSKYNPDYENWDNEFLNG